jgi:hypothetical protein
VALGAQGLDLGLERAQLVAQRGLPALQRLALGHQVQLELAQAVELAGQQVGVGDQRRLALGVPGVLLLDAGAPADEVAVAALERRQL